MIAAILFLVLGVYLTASSFALPAGIAGQPGPGFFPRGIGALMVLLSLAALRSRGSDAPAIENYRTIAATIGLTAVYLLLWGTGGFPLKTLLYLVILLRCYGQGWRPAAVVALVLTGAVTAGFQYGLRLTLE
jgi:hypothetical protein